MTSMSESDSESDNESDNDNDSDSESDSDGDYDSRHPRGISPSRNRLNQHTLIYCSVICSRVVFS